MASWSIDHISAVTVPVGDMRESVAFYQSLGFRVSYGGPEASFTTVRAGESVINLRHVSGGVGNPWARVIVRVSGIDALHGHLVGKGLAPTALRDAEWGERYFEIADPAGSVISFAQLR
jgi:catechol 2,3-dioxygenase-like lactoylglutathione lyase family enzyme